MTNTERSVKIAPSPIIKRKRKKISLKGVTLKKIKKIAKDTLDDILKELVDSQLLLVASSLAYTTILSIVPLLAVSFSIFYSFGGMEKALGIIEPFIIQNLTEGTSGEVMNTIRGFIENARSSTIGVSGMVALIITSMTMLSSIEKAFQKIWKTNIKRSLFQRVTTYWFFITLGPLSLSVLIGVLSSNKTSFVLPSQIEGFFYAVLFFFAIYKWVPLCKVQGPPALISATIAASLWSIAKFIYSIYTHNVLTYSKIYGSLAAIPILLLWVYIAWIIVLSGASLTASLQRRWFEE